MTVTWAFDERDMNLHTYTWPAHMNMIVIALRLWLQVRRHRLALNLLTHVTDEPVVAEWGRDARGYSYSDGLGVRTLSGVEFLEVESDLTVVRVVNLTTHRTGHIHNSGTGTGAGTGEVRRIHKKNRRGEAHSQVQARKVRRIHSAVPQSITSDFTFYLQV